MKYLLGMVAGILLGALVVAAKTRTRAYTTISRSGYNNDYNGGSAW